MQIVATGSQAWIFEVAMSYYVGAEPKNPVQCEKFWRNRIDAEEVVSRVLIGVYRALETTCQGAAVRATANST